MKTLIGKLFDAPLAILSWVLLIAGISGVFVFFGLGIIGEFEPPGSLKSFLSAWLTFQRRVSLTFLLFGGLAVFGGRSKNRSLSGSAGILSSSGWLFVVLVTLSLQVVAAFAFSQSIADSIREYLRLLEGWGLRMDFRLGGDFSALTLLPAFLLFMAPGFTAMTAIVFMAGNLCTLAYLILNLKGSPRVAIRSLCLQVGCLTMLFITQIFFEACSQFLSGMVADAGEKVLKSDINSLIIIQKTILDESTTCFPWLLPGFLACVAIIVKRSHAASLNMEALRVEVPKVIERKKHTPPRPESVVFQAESEFKDDSYVIKYKFSAHPFNKVFEVLDSFQTVFSNARMNGWNPYTRVIRVYHVAGENHQKDFTITGRRFLRFPNHFVHTDDSTGRIMGRYKQSGAEWVITDEIGRQMGILMVEKRRAASVDYGVWVRQARVCRLSLFGFARPSMTIAFSEDGEKFMEKHMVIGLALVICFQSVAFNYVYLSN